MLSVSQHAETVRTLVSGVLPGRVHTLHGSHPLRHAMVGNGDVLMLLRDDSDAATELHAPGLREVPAAFAVADVPRLPVAPSRGTAWLVGWVRPLTDRAARCAAVDLIEEFPSGELLDVGHGRTFWRLAVSGGWLDGPDGQTTFTLDEYRAARPDPLHAQEAVLLAHLDYCHRDTALELARLVVPTARSARPVGLDRHGLKLWYDCDGISGHARVDFPRPVSAPADLAGVIAALLRGVRPRTRDPHGSSPGG